jgi:hypothetical protein
MKKKEKVTEEYKTDIEYILMYGEEISKIDNCPSKSEKGSIEVVRLVKTDPATKEDLILHSKIYPKLADKCEAWGISVFKKPTDIKDVKKILSKKIASNYNLASYFTISDDMGIKYQNGSNKEHYTFFPNKDLDLLSTFVTENI